MHNVYKTNRNIMNPTSLSNNNIKPFNHTLDFYYYYFFFEIFIHFKSHFSLVAQRVKCLPTMWETRVQPLGRQDLLEKEMATHSSILAWKIPWTVEPGRLQSMGSQRVGHD